MHKPSEYELQLPKSTRNLTWQQIGVAIELARGGALEVVSKRSGIHPLRIRRWLRSPRYRAAVEWMRETR